VTPANEPIRIRRVDGVVHVTFNDSYVLGDERIERIGEILYALIVEEAQPRLLIDFSGVKFISSMMLGTLVTVNSRITAKQGQLRLANLAPRIRVMLLVTQFDSLFSIQTTSETEADADADDTA
jgi:anti-anti-sigma factor